ncbi:MAG: glycosyltransferase family 4 protein [Candidatus Latescibacterota bacterium]|nr:glycosyltransferase family 4 protein [Candidatus Latescibacterota bacterium]
MQRTSAEETPTNQPTTARQKPLRVLFVTRRFPPSRGGAQTHAFKLYQYLRQRMPLTLIALRRESILHLAWFLPWAWLRAFFLLLFRRVDIIYFADGVAASVASGLGLVRGPAQLVCSIFGLEMTLGNRLAQGLIREGALQCAGIAVISANSRRIAVDCGLPDERIRLIYVGVEPVELSADRLTEMRRSLESELSVRFGGDRLIVNVGRQVRRKGIADFIKHGVARLEGVRLIVVGTGPMAAEILAARDRLPDPDQVIILGSVDDDTCSALRTLCDLFVMPNVPTPGDVEGYGIAPLEAMYNRTPVVSFAVDALVEAVREGGWLIESGDYEGFAESVRRFYDQPEERRLQEGEDARAYVLREYGWDTSASRYEALFRAVHLNDT